MSLNRRRLRNDTGTPPPLGVTFTGVHRSEEIDLGSYRVMVCLGNPEGVRRLIDPIVSTLVRRSTCQVIVVGDCELGGIHASIEHVLGVDEVRKLLNASTLPTLVLAHSQHVDPLVTLQTTLGSTRPFTLLSGETHRAAEIVLTVDEDGRYTTYSRRTRPPRPHEGAPDDATLLDWPTPSTPPISVNILGPVAISGTDYPLERHPKLTELVVYLALHENGATSRNWTTALWPERRVPAQTISNRLSEARRILGFAADGRPRMRRSGDRHFLVEVTSDWASFQQLSAPTATPDEWEEALGLVRGRPFDELAQGQWVVFEGFTGEIETRIAECALALGEHALDSRTPDLATWAVQQALRACPFDERLHRLLMRCADAEGNRAGVEATLRQLALILEIDGDPLYGVHPETAELYAQLIGGAHRRSNQNEVAPRHN